MSTQLDVVDLERMAASSSSAHYISRCVEQIAIARYLPSMSILRHFDDHQRPDNPRRRLYTSPTAERQTMTNKVTRAKIASRDHGWLSSVAGVSRVTGNG